ncbi:MAG: HAMP domain-containing protein, partial [Planctomycetia bacterium]|nr:HAMP domain-containing protein [Planctomycetia bacterium]
DLAPVLDELLVARIDARRTAILESIGLTAVLTLLAALAAWSISSASTRAVRRQIATIAQIADGDVSASPPDLDLDNDFGRLANGVEAFRQAILQRDRLAAALDEERRTLETRVAERTAEFLAARRQADEEVRHVVARFESARSEFASTKRTREEREADLAAERRALLELHVQRTALEAVHGTNRKQRLRSLADDRAAKEAAARATAQKLRDLTPDDVRIEQERYENTVKVTTEAINDANVRRARAEADLERGGTTDPHGDKAAADARHETAKRRHAEIEQRAHAVRHLRDLFEKRRQERADLVAAPLCRKVREYLDSLFGPGNQVSIRKANEKFADLTVARPTAGGLDFEFDVLSGGTREQVAATWRLAMAEVLAEGGGGDTALADACLPMVFDDAFVNSDPERIEAVRRVLYLASRRGLQIIVLSCNPQEYASFANKRIDLPRPKHVATGVPAATSAAPPAGGGGSDDA